jgi:hypothetical protein
MPESPRWLLTKGKWDRARNSLRKMASINGKVYPEDFDLKTIETRPVRFQTVLQFLSEVCNIVSVIIRIICCYYYLCRNPLKRLQVRHGNCF